MIESPIVKPLDKDDLATPAWKKLAKHYEARLEELRKRNDNSSLDAEATARLRGRIAEVKYLLALADPPPMIGADEP